MACLTHKALTRCVVGGYNLKQLGIAVTNFLEPFVARPSQA